MKLSTDRLVVLATVCSLALGISACSKSEPIVAPTASTSTTSVAPAPTAAEIIDKAKANAKAATSGAFKGEITQSGETMKIDFKGTNDGKTADVTVDMGSAGKVRILSVGGTVYMQASAAFWRAQGAPAEIQKAGDKFVKAPTEATGLLDELTLGKFLDEAFSELKASEVSQTVGQESVDGVDCWVVTDKRGKDQGALYVSKDKLQIVRFSGSKDTPGQIDFSSWNEDLGIKAPSPDQVITIP